MWFEHSFNGNIKHATTHGYSNGTSNTKQVLEHTTANKLYSKSLNQSSTLAIFVGEGLRRYLAEDFPTSVLFLWVLQVCGKMLNSWNKLTFHLGPGLSIISKIGLRHSEVDFQWGVESRELWENSYCICMSVVLDICHVSYDWKWGL